MTCVTVEVLVEYEIEELDVVMTTGGSLLVVLPSEEVVDEVSSVEVEVVLSEIGEDDVVATVEVVTKVVLEVLGVVVEGKEVVLEVVLLLLLVVVVVVEEVVLIVVAGGIVEVVVGIVVVEVEVVVVMSDVLMLEVVVVVVLREDVVLLVVVVLVVSIVVF